jgi:hypothetical protein
MKVVSVSSQFEEYQKGAHIFHGDEDTQYTNLGKSGVEAESPELRELYEDFCIIRNHGQLYRCPKNFNLMTISWYLNEPKSGEQPNVRCGENARYRARGRADGR